LERLTLKTAERDWGNAKVDELSRGMQQKVQFIACLLHEPDVIVLDEPFSGLDPINTQSLKDIVIELRRRGKTILFSTHLMESAERLCDSVCIIARGEKVLDGAVAQVKSEHGVRHVALAVGHHTSDGVRALLDDTRLVKHLDDQNRFFEIELADGANPQELLRRVVALGVPIERFELIQPSLHQIFLDRVGARGVETGLTGHG
jgi:ABC-2 type transport system ATP-binding protein